MKKYVIFILLVIVFSFSCSNNKRIDEKLHLKNDFSKSISFLTKKITKIYEKNNITQKKKLAVISLVNADGNKSELGRYAANLTQEKIFNPKLFSLLERERIDSLLDEHKLNKTGLFTSIDTKKLGKLLGADLVFVGTLNLNKEKSIEYLSVHARIVNLESGEINSIASVNIMINSNLKEKYYSLVDKKVSSYKIILSDLKVSGRKRDGRAWDGVFAAPDLKIYVASNSSKTFSSKSYSEQYSINEEFLTNFISAKKGLEIKLMIFDVDDLEDDIIGKKILYEKDILDIVCSKEPVLLSFDQVEKIKIQIKPFVSSNSYKKRQETSGSKDAEKKLDQFRKQMEEAAKKNQ